MAPSERLRRFLHTHGPYLVAVLALTAIMLFLWGEIDYTIEPYSRWDGWHYRQMAQAAPGISPIAAAPFRYRVLGTYPIGLLPIDTILAFRIVNYSLFLLLAVLFYLFLSFVGIRRSIAVYTVALFTMSTYLFGVTAWYTFHTNDALALIFMLMGLWALMTRRWGLFALSLLLGALSRETWILMPPVAFVYLWERKLLAADWKKLLLATVPALVAFALLRILLHADVQGSIDIPKAFIRYSPKIVEPRVLGAAVRQHAQAADLPPADLLQHDPDLFQGQQIHAGLDRRDVRQQPARLGRRTAHGTGLRGVLLAIGADIREGHLPAQRHARLDRRVLLRVDISLPPSTLSAAQP